MLPSDLQCSVIIYRLVNSPVNKKKLQTDLKYKCSKKTKYEIPFMFFHAELSQRCKQFIQMRCLSVVKKLDEEDLCS